MLCAAHIAVVTKCYFLLAPSPPPSQMTFIRALEYTRVPYVGKNKWPELKKVVLNQANKPLHAGDMELSAALDAIQSSIEMILQQL